MISSTTSTRHTHSSQHGTHGPGSSVASSSQVGVHSPAEKKVSSTRIGSFRYTPRRSAAQNMSSMAAAEDAQGLLSSVEIDEERFVGLLTKLIDNVETLQNNPSQVRWRDKSREPMCSIA